MKIGLADVDGHNFPNLPLMKLSAWHKKRGDSVGWYIPAVHGFPAPPMDRVYLSKVFSFTPDYQDFVNAAEVVKGGSGYCISYHDGRETYDKNKDAGLPYEVEHMYPDYGLYGITDTAYGFLSRGCPRGCPFCHVAAKEGACSRKVADLGEFWRGQKTIRLCAPNILACPAWKDLLGQLADSRAKVTVSQGLDIRLMTVEKAEMTGRLRADCVHFAWDRYGDKGIIVPKLKMFKEVTGWKSRKTGVYVLVNYDTSIEQDLERIYTLRDLDYDPYVMIYNKQDTKPWDPVRNLQRWVNNRKIFKTVRRFEDYDPGWRRKVSKEGWERYGDRHKDAGSYKEPGTLCIRKL